MKIAEEKMKKAADTIRCLCSDMIDKANSGHPGAPLGLADIAVSLWLNYLNFDPKDVRWPGRDRLVFSGGHASSLLYALFHIAGVEAATMDELKNFRQLGSKAAEIVGMMLKGEDLRSGLADVETQDGKYCFYLGEKLRAKRES